MVTSWVLAGMVALQPQADTLVVRVDNAPEWGNHPTLVEEVRIGVLEGPVEESFTTIRGFVVLDDGEMWVGDGAEVRRFGPEGDFLGYLGREGEGPGEFKGIAGMGRMPDGRVVIFDPWQGRINYFSPDGVFDSSAPRAIGVIMGPYDVFRVSDEGSLLQFWSLPNPDSQSRRLPIWYHLDEEGTVTDSVWAPPSGRRVLGGQDYAFGIFGGFSPMAVSAMSPRGYLVQAHTSEYALHYPLPDGRTVRLEREYDAVRVDGEERSQFRAHAAHVAGLWGPDAGLGDDIPGEKPPFWSVRIDGEGRLWVARHSHGVLEPESAADRAEREELGRLRGSVPPPVEWWEPLTLDVIEPAGRFVGSVTLPNRQSVLLDARGDSVWVTERGDFDEEYVVRYRVVPGGGP
ncbi:MAG: hypothetical protein AAF389_20060 [Gemmatimonadota bacterium]